MTWSKTQRTPKIVSPAFTLSNLEILALGVSVIPSIFCFFPSPSCRASLQAGKVGWHQSGLSFLREDKLEMRVTTGQTGMMLPQNQQHLLAHEEEKQGRASGNSRTQGQPSDQQAGKQQAGSLLVPTCPRLISAESVSSGLRYCGASLQGAQGGTYQERWSEKTRTNDALRALSSCG